MRNIKLTIEYDGTDYCGWQIQTKNRKTRSIQEIIQRGLTTILKEDIKVTGSGRTDSGVHAKGQVANFKTSSKMPLEKLHRSINGILPGQIRIKRISSAPEDFNARFDTSSKVYRYTIINGLCTSAFFDRFAYFVPHKLDVNEMRKASKAFLGKHNFSAFRLLDKFKSRSDIKEIKDIKIKKDKDLLYVDIEADGFLHNMARRIVGSLIQIGLGKITNNDIILALNKKAKMRKVHRAYTAPGKGLCLMEV